jgi:Fe-S-cluster containining protein
MAPVPPLPGEEDDDRALLAAVQDSLSQGERTLQGRLDYGRGCPRCCYGPFPINVLDARRLRRGLAHLAVRDASRAAGIVARAQAQTRRFAEGFPGAEGRLGPDDTAVEAFCARHAAEACPALSSEGRCDLYEWRPLACRTFGPPVRIGAQDLPACSWCFAGTPEEADQVVAVVDPEGREDALLTRIESAGDAGDTVIAFALAGPR